MGTLTNIKIKSPSYSRDTELYSLKHIPKVYIPVPQGYTLTVKEGECVKAGQLLGVAFGRQIPLYSSVSGTVKGTFYDNGKEYLEIENDEKYEPSGDIAPCPKRLSQMSDDEIIERIRLCGINEWKKLEEMKGKAKRFVLNCLDGDPYCFDKRCVCIRYAREIINGAKIILKLTSLRLCEIVIEHSNLEGINSLIDNIGSSSLFDIIDTKAKYPYTEQQRIITHISDDGNFEEDEVLVIDAHTAAAVYNAFSLGMPYITRAVSVGGSASDESGCYSIPLGTPIEYIRDYCVNKEKTPVFSTVTGSIMKGELVRGELSVIEQDSHFVCFINKSELTYRVSECIGCGKCDSVCPEKLLPSVFISEHEKDFTFAKDKSGMDWCTNCGACSYICPAKIPICELANGKTKILSPEKRYKKATKKNSPFIWSAESVRSMNFDIVFSLLVLLSWSVFCFGIKALLIALISVSTAVFTELAYNFLTRSGSFGVLNLSSVVCGLLGAFTLSVNVPLYAPVITAFISVMFLRGAFGGNGKNLFHSAFGARIIASLLFHDAFVYQARKYTDFDFLIGNRDGALGEISVILLCAVLIYLLIRRIISIITPALIISTFAVVSFLLTPSAYEADSVKITLLGSSILFVSVFSGIEYSSVPKSKTGKMAYGALLGALAAVIGRFTDYEGAYISAVIASLLTPLFNRFYCANTEPVEYKEDSYNPYFDTEPKVPKNEGEGSSEGEIFVNISTHPQDSENEALERLADKIAELDSKNIK